MLGHDVVREPRAVRRPDRRHRSVRRGGRDADRPGEPRAGRPVARAAAGGGPGTGRPSCWSGSSSADAGRRRVSTYSGGMRRRLDLAMTLVRAPRLLVLDEPTTGLDTRSRQTLWDEIRLLAAAGSTVLLTTQYLEEADALADRIVVLDDGRMVADGSPDALKREGGRRDGAGARRRRCGSSASWRPTGRPPMSPGSRRTCRPTPAVTVRRRQSGRRLPPAHRAAGRQPR